ncbi:lysophospholipid acyltransferase family protein [Mariprofundus sp. KV]|uniref:lysophospholipid acyltransferase family protein n=1 Tax=Mariprofundus sp. KV TaxID=2608715 RepID=UPI0015A133C4|nr:lysophospholipid acyltransferase family protein [Mariprofundus sp. KV]NWF35761.1 lysophospholipid acyltransferase family protein [Mariprofundus sp. KV]
MTLLVKSLFFLVQLLPVRLLGALGAGLGRFIYLIDGRHRNIALRNLNRIYPDRDDAWKIRTAHESFAELGRTMFEVPHVFMRSKAYLNSRIEVEGESLYRDAIAQGNGVILTAMHHSNWELGALAISLLGHESDMIYRSLRQPALDQFILTARSRFGTILHSRSEGLRWLPRAMKNGHTIAIMIDQHLSNGTPIPFLGHLANTTTLPATVASKYNAPLIGVTLDRIGRSFRFKLRFRPILIPGSNGEVETDEGRIMRMVCDSFAPLIDQRPELWLWIHRRWLYLDERESQQA